MWYLVFGELKFPFKEVHHTSVIHVWLRKFPLIISVGSRVAALWSSGLEGKRADKVPVVTWNIYLLLCLWLTKITAYLDCNPCGLAFPPYRIQLQFDRPEPSSRPSSRRSRLPRSLPWHRWERQCRLAIQHWRSCSCWCIHRNCHSRSHGRLQSKSSGSEAWSEDWGVLTKPDQVGREGGDLVGFHGCNQKTPDSVIVGGCQGCGQAKAYKKDKESLHFAATLSSYM